MSNTTTAIEPADTVASIAAAQAALTSDFAALSEAVANNHANAAPADDVDGQFKTLARQMETLAAHIAALHAAVGTPQQTVASIVAGEPIAAPASTAATVVTPARVATIESRLSRVIAAIEAQFGIGKIAGLPPAVAPAVAPAVVVTTPAVAPAATVAS
jgi:hypothetical protein